MRQEKLGEGGRDGRLTKYITETFGRSPTGGRTPSGKGGRQPEASLAWTWGDPGCEALDSEDVGREMEPRKQYLWRPTLSERRKAASSPRVDLGLTTPPGSESGARIQGLPRNLGDLLDSNELPGVRPPGEQGPDHLSVCGHARGRPRTSEPAVGTAKRTQGSAAGGSSRSRSAFTVAMKRGNRPEGPRGAKEGAGVRRRARER